MSALKWSNIDFDRRIINKVVEKERGRRYDDLPVYSEKNIEKMNAQYPTSNTQ